MKVLLTGGGGFLGADIVEELRRCGVYARVYDICAPRLSPGENVEFLAGDIFDADRVCDAFRGIDLVIHLVGVKDAHLAEADPDGSFRLNVLSLQRVLEMCRLNRTPIVFPSSAAVYGRTDVIPVSESNPIRPTGIYGFQKWLCEELIRSYHVACKVHFKILRLFNVYGKGNKNIIDHCIRAAKEEKPIQVFGSGQLRDFIFLGDVAKAFREAVVKDDLMDRAVNVGSGRGRTIRDVVEFVYRVLPELQVEYVEKKGFSPYDSVADTGLMENLLGFTAECSEAFFLETVMEMVKDADERVASLVGG